MKKPTLRKWRKLLVQEHNRVSTYYQALIQGMATFAAIFFGIWIGQMYSPTPENIPWPVIVVFVILTIGFYLLFKKIEQINIEEKSMNNAIQLLNTAITDYTAKSLDEGFMKNVESSVIEELKKYNSTRLLI